MKDHLMSVDWLDLIHSFMIVSCWIYMCISVGTTWMEEP